MMVQKIFRYLFICQKALANTVMCAVMTAALLFNVAQAGSPVGKWRTIDDASGQAMSIIEISELNSQLSGKILKLLAANDPSITCEKCKGRRKGKTVLGMEILWGIMPQGKYWGGGKIIDSNNCEIYKVRLSLVENGNRLKVRGYIGAPVLGCTQVWHRAEG